MIETDKRMEMAVRQPTLFQEITPAPEDFRPAASGWAPPDRVRVEGFLFENVLQPWLEENAQLRAHEIGMVSRHVEISLNALIDRQQLQLAEYLNRQVEGRTVPDWMA